MNHLLLITTSYPDTSITPGRDAAGSFVADIAEALADLCRVTVIAPSYQASRTEQGNLVTHRFAVPSLPLSLLRPTKSQHWPLIWQTFSAGEEMVRNVVAEESVDHLLALWALPSGAWAQRVAQRQRLPYSVWALGSDIWTLGKLPFIRSWLRHILRNSHTSFADGYQLQRDVEAIAGRACAFLPSARKLSIAAVKDPKAAPPYNLAFLGRWHPHKGVDLLLDALHLLTPADWAQIAAVRICGGGPLESLVHREVQALQEAGYPITVEGYLGKAEAAALLTWADYLLIPSRIESIPVIFSDAMQAACPVVTTPVGDLPRLLQEHQVGILSVATNAAAFAQAIRMALQGSPQQFSLGLTTAAAAFRVESIAASIVARLSAANAAS